MFPNQNYITMSNEKMEIVLANLNDTVEKLNSHFKNHVGQVDDYQIELLKDANTILSSLINEVPPPIPNMGLSGRLLNIIKPFGVFLDDNLSDIDSYSNSPENENVDNLSRIKFPHDNLLNNS